MNNRYNTPQCNTYQSCNWQVKLKLTTSWTFLNMNLWSISRPYLADTVLYPRLFLTCMGYILWHICITLMRNYFWLWHILILIHYILNKDNTPKSLRNIGMALWQHNGLYYYVESDCNATCNCIAIIQCCFNDTCVAGGCIPTLCFKKINTLINTFLSYIS